MKKIMCMLVFLLAVCFIYGDIVNLSNLPASSSTHPWVVAQGNKVMVAWQEEGGYSGTEKNIYYSVFAGGFWSPPKVCYDTPVISKNPHISLGTEGDVVHLIWADDVSSSREIYYGRFASGAWQGSPEKVLTCPYNSNWAKIGQLDDGILEAVWANAQTEGISDHWIIQANYKVNNDWKSGLIVSDNTESTGEVNLAMYPQLAHFSGVSYCVWPQRGPAGSEIMFSERSGTEWSVPRAITPVGTYTWPGLVVDSTGNIHVICSKTGGKVWYTSRHDGRWSTLEAVNNNTEHLRGFTSLAVDTDDGLHAVYQVGIYIYYSYKPYGQPWKDEIQVSEGTVTGDRFPAIDVGDGYIYITWCSGDEGEPSDVYYRKLSLKEMFPPEAQQQPVDPEPVPKPASKLVTISKMEGMKYTKPEGAFAPSGAVYIAYEVKTAAGRSDIHLSRYENGKVSFIKNLSNSPARSYEPDIAIQKDGSIHVAWIDQAGKNIITKYRCFDGSSWSDIRTFGQLDRVDFVEDLRIAVDDSGNAFVAFTYWPGAKCRLIYKYGDNIKFEAFPFGGRAKHAEMRADKNYVLMAWQYFDNGKYTIAYSRRPNKPQASWEPWQDLGHYGTQRPRLQIDKSGYLHLCYAFKTGSTRKMFYKIGQGNGFGRFEEISSSQTFHFFDMAAVDRDNVIVTMQKGSGSGGKNVSYNWKRNGTWTGYTFFPETASRKPAWQSVAMSADGSRIALAFAEKDEAVHLILSGSPVPQPDPDPEPDPEPQPDPKPDPIDPEPDPQPNPQPQPGSGFWGYIMKIYDGSAIGYAVKYNEFGNLDLSTVYVRFPVVVISTKLDIAFDITSDNRVGLSFGVHRNNIHIDIGPVWNLTKGELSYRPSLLMGINIPILKK